MIPPKDDLTICFAHVAYALNERFGARGTGIRSFQVWSRDELDARIGEPDVLVCSSLWHDGFLDKAPKLGFIQAVSAGVDFFGADKLAARGVRLASARGVNARAVSDHAVGLMLALIRRFPEARDNQAKHVWRGMVRDRGRREDELGDKTVLIVGLGAIGDRLARLAKAFDMHVIGVRRDPAAGRGNADEVHGLDALEALLPRADFVVLVCPLTKETANLVNARTLGRMKPSAFLVNAARGGCVDEAALTAALSEGRIAGAAIDVAAEEPLPQDSPVWDLPNLFITPHTAGETGRYEDNVLDILQDNLDRLWRGERALRNQVV